MCNSGQRVELVERAVCDELSVAPDLDEPGVVVGVDDDQADLRVGEQVSTLCRSSVVLTRAQSPSTSPTPGAKDRKARGCYLPA